MREYRKVVQTGEDSVKFYLCSWFLTFDSPFFKRLYLQPPKKDYDFGGYFIHVKNGYYQALSSLYEDEWKHDTLDVL